MGVRAGLYMYDVVVEKFTFAIPSHDEFLLFVVLYVNFLLSRRQCESGLEALTSSVLCTVSLQIGSRV